jgi:hypothetical protein
MTVVQMSDRELTRPRVMIGEPDGRATPEAAVTLMRIGRHQLFRSRSATDRLEVTLFMSAYEASLSGAT